MRKLVLLAALAVLLLLAGRTYRVAALDPEGLLRHGDPARSDYERYLSRFDDRRFGFVRLKYPDGADVVTLSERFSDFLSHQGAVSRVISPQNARFFLGSEYFSFSSLFPKPVLNEDARDRLRFEVWRRTLYPDEPASLVILFELAFSSAESQERELAVALGSFLDETARKYPGLEAMAGGPRIQHGLLLERTRKAGWVVLPSLLFLIFLALSLLLRSPLTGGAGLAAALTSSAVTVVVLRAVSGGVSLFGIEALGIGLVASGIFSFLLFARLQTVSGRLSQRLAEVGKVERPALAVALAGAAAFLGYTTSRLAPEREFGWVCAGALLIAWGVTFRALPYALLELGYHPANRKWRFKLPFKLTAKQVRSGRVVLAVAVAAIFAVSAFVSRRSRPNDDIVSAFAPVAKVDVLLKPKYWDVFDPDNQAEIMALEQKIADLPGVERVSSLVGFSDDLLSILAMRQPGQGEKLRKELLTALDEAGALADFRPPGSKEARTVVWLRQESALEETLGALEAISRQYQGRISLQIAGVAALRKALSTP